MQLEYEQRSLPLVRRGIIDYLGEAWRRHTIKALFDFDITDTRRAIRAYRREHGTPLSLSTYLLYSYARAVAKYPGLQTYRKGGLRVVVFRAVDMSVIVERNVGGERTTTTYIVRNAHEKSMEEIDEELRAAKQATNESAFTGNTERNPGERFSRLPRFLRRTILAYAMRRRPLLRRRLFGTVSFTSVAMFGTGRGWAVPITPHALNLVVGGLERLPRFRGGELVEREILHVTLSMDHDFVDGAVATRFLDELKRGVETCKYL